MSTRDDMITLYQDRYLKKCQQVSELRLKMLVWQFFAWMGLVISAVLFGVLIWG